MITNMLPPVAASHEPEPERNEREQRYEEHIKPLVSRIFMLCKEHDIPGLLTFQLAPEREQIVEMRTTAYTPPWADGRVAIARLLLGEAGSIVQLVPIDDPQLE